MPKGPISYREMYMSPVRGSGAGGNSDRNVLLKHLEWNKVETELGTMVEARSLTPQVGGNTDKIAQLDLTDNAFNAVKIMDEGDFQSTFGTGGAGCIDYNA